MSKIGKKPVQIKEGVSVSFGNREIRTEGPKGSLSFNIPQGIDVRIEDTLVQVIQKDKGSKETRPMMGLVRSIISNMIIGVSVGFEKKLELRGVGYRTQISGEDLTINVGFSHPVKISPGPGIRFSLVDNVIIVSGIEKELVGNAAARIRAIRPPEPYKGKGIRYQGEYIRRKAGKAAKAVGAAK